MIAGMGMAAGHFYCLTNVSWPKLFGRKHLGAISGLNMGFIVISSAIGPPIFGASESATGSYDTALIISAIFSSILFLASLTVKRK